MEQKTNPSGQQAAPDKGTQREPSAWLQEVINTVDPLAQALDLAQDKDRAIVMIAVHEGSTVAMTAGGTTPLAFAVKEGLTGENFARHLVNACRLMAVKAAQNTGGTVEIHVKPEPTTGTAGQEAKTDED